MNRDQLPADAIDRCRSCNAEIVWAAHQRTLKPMPVEITPSSTGNLALTVTNGAVHCRVVKPELAFGRRDLHESHFVRCPDAPKWRQR